MVYCQGERKMATVIIGGGIAGLSAGYHLDDGVVILEKGDCLGGLCSSYQVNGYSVEKFYHHFFEGDRALQELCRELGVGLEWHTGTVGYSFGGVVYPMNTMPEILAYPYMGLLEKLRLGLFTLKCKREDPLEHTGETAVDYIKRNVGEPVYDKFFLPLLKGKFGDDYHDVSAAWLIVRIKLRSNRGRKGEKLGYVDGGFQRLVDGMADAIIKKGGIIKLNTPVEDIVVRDSAVRGVRTPGGIVEADHVVCTSPGLMLKYADAKGAYFQKTVCTLFSLKKKLSDTYWVNIGDDLSFKALIEHTNLIPYERYREHLVYAVVYSSRPLDPGSTLAAFKEDLKKYGIGEEDISWYRTYYETATAPMYHRSYHYIPYESKIKNLYFAGLFSRPNHSGRLVNGSILAGKEVAELITQRL